MDIRVLLESRIGYIFGSVKIIPWPMLLPCQLMKCKRGSAKEHILYIIPCSTTIQLNWQHYPFRYNSEC